MDILSTIFETAKAVRTMIGRQQWRCLWNTISGSQKIKETGETKGERWFAIACQLTYTWLIPWADDDGLIKAETFQIQANVVPWVKVSMKEIERILKRLDEVGLITVYKVDQEQYVAIAEWEKHQKIRNDRKKPSIFPRPRKFDNQVSTCGQPSVNLTITPTPTPTPTKHIREKEEEAKREIWFLEFWDAYGKKIDKAKCAEHYQLHIKTQEEHREVMAGIDRWRHSGNWDDDTFQPYPMTFLRNERWRDEPPKRMNERERKRAELTAQFLKGDL